MLMFKILAGRKFFLPFQKSLISFELCFKTIIQEFAEIIPTFTKSRILCIYYYTVVLLNLGYLVISVAPYNDELICSFLYCFLWTNCRNENFFQAHNYAEVELCYLGWHIFQASSTNLNQISRSRLWVKLGTTKTQINSTINNIFFFSCQPLPFPRKL